MDAKTIKFVKSQKMQGMSEFEKDAYLQMIERLGLDLLTDEIVFLRGKPYITRDGLLHIARSRDDLESITYITIYKGFKGDSFKIFTIDLDRMIQKVQNDMSYGNEINLLPPDEFDEIEPYAVICRVKRKDRGVFEGIAWLEDYTSKIRGKGMSAWKTATYTMLTVRALTKALKIAYAVGMTSVEEIAEIKAVEMDMEASKGSETERLKLLNDITSWIEANAKDPEKRKALKGKFVEILGKKVANASYKELKEAFDKLKGGANE